MNQFVHTLCNSSYWYLHRSLMTIYFKSRGIWVQLWCINWTESKNRKNLSLFFTVVTRYIPRHILLFCLFPIYVICYIGIPQKPRDRLFQKSGHLGLTGCINRKQTKIDKFAGFFFMIVTKYLTRWVLRVHLVTLCEIHHNGIIQKPHDHLFQKSEAYGFNLSALTRKQTKIVKCKFFFFIIVTKYVTRQVLWVNLFTLYVIHHIGITQKPHDHLF